jgi:hypothetical protein
MEQHAYDKARKERRGYALVYADTRKHLTLTLSV